MKRFGLIVVVAATLAGCASASPYATVAYCTPAGVRTPPTAGVGGLVASVNALPAAGACGALQQAGAHGREPAQQR
jgi:hypothetical protein